MSYFIETITSFDLSDIIENKTKTAIIPIGIIEQHGYHLPLGTDIYNTSELLKRCGDDLNAIIMQPVNYCYSGGGMCGTINTNPQIFGMLVNDICLELVKIGIKNIVILIGHGGTENSIGLEYCIKDNLRRFSDFDDVAIALAPCWNFSPTWQTGFTMTPEHDFHAGLMETSLMLYWKPELVKKEIRQDTPEICKMLRTDPDWYAEHIKSYDNPMILAKSKQKDCVKYGVMGFPEKATAELGEKICAEMISNLCKFVNELNSR